MRSGVDLVRVWCRLAGSRHFRLFVVEARLRMIMVRHPGVAHHAQSRVRRPFRY
jgi:hypothetical protein